MKLLFEGKESNNNRKNPKGIRLQTQSHNSLQSYDTCKAILQVRPRLFAKELNLATCAYTVETFERINTTIEFTAKRTGFEHGVITIYNSDTEKPVDQAKGRSFFHAVLKLGRKHKCFTIYNSININNVIKQILLAFCLHKVH